MNSLTSNLPLADDEFDRLAAFLDSIGDAAMNIETLDGYFAALICGPDIVLPSEYLPQIWGGAFSFESDGQATEIIGLLMRHWNTISTELLKTLHEPNVYLPVLLEREDGTAPANDWAHGFMRGVQLRSASWDELIHSEDHGGPIVAIMMLRHEHDSDPQMRPPPIPAENREELLQTIIAGLTHMYRYFEPHRRALASISGRTPVRRDEPKIGRNEPCPCGSGRKYKYCCLTNPPTFH
ncbi:TPA: UPF0149 family protein [Burkholderia multivorans]|nr:UPF0149 family protein [Burkholderia multivorans]